MITIKETKTAPVVLMTTLGCTVCDDEIYGELVWEQNITKDFKEKARLQKLIKSRYDKIDKEWRK